MSWRVAVIGSWDLTNGFRKPSAALIVDWERFLVFRWNRYERSNTESPSEWRLWRGNQGEAMETTLVKPTNGGGSLEPLLGPIV